VGVGDEKLRVGPRDDLRSPGFDGGETGPSSSPPLVPLVTRRSRSWPGTVSPVRGAPPAPPRRRAAPSPGAPATSARAVSRQFRGCPGLTVYPFVAGVRWRAFFFGGAGSARGPGSAGWPMPQVFYFTGSRASDLPQLDTWPMPDSFDQPGCVCVHVIGGVTSNLQSKPRKSHKRATKGR